MDTLENVTMAETDRRERAVAESKRPEGLEAVDLGLLHGKLDVTGLFRHVQSLRLEISSHAELSGTRLRLSEQNLRD